MFDKIINGDSLKVLKTIDSESVDLVFADPPYNLQLQTKNLSRPDDSIVDAVNDSWDSFDSYEQYDNFCKEWLIECRRVLKKNGAIWVIGSYHNIFRLGTILQDLGYWIMNDVIWVKNNPMPNFRGTRLTNAHETLIWAGRDKSSKPTFNYQSMKAFNDDVQLRSDWNFPICNGSERLKDDDGKKLHSTQKPETLLHRVILNSTKPGDIVLDPFSGSGTTCAVAKKLGRKFIGIEQDEKYYKYSLKRIQSVKKQQELEVVKDKKQEVKVPFGHLVESGYLKPGENLVSKCNKHKAKILADGSLVIGDVSGSIHKVGAILQSSKSCNGWDYWSYSNKGNIEKIDALRNEFRSKLKK